MTMVGDWKRNRKAILLQPLLWRFNFIFMTAGLNMLSIGTLYTIA